MSHRFGFVSLTGRPNTGKSTLLNRILGSKLSITSHKPHTTCACLTGLKNTPRSQIAFVDTPGLDSSPRRARNHWRRGMNGLALSALSEVNLIVLVVDCSRWSEADEWVAKHIESVEQRKPLIIAINKIDRLSKRTQLLPRIRFLDQYFARDKEIVPISARKGDNIERLQGVIESHLPFSEPMFPREQLTDCSDEYLASELLREKLMRRIHKEIPYALSVSIEKWVCERSGLLRIDALVWVERSSHKPVVLGVRGERMREIATAARLDMERLFGRKVMLRTWVKVGKQQNHPHEKLSDGG